MAFGPARTVAIALRPAAPWSNGGYGIGCRTAAMALGPAPTAAMAFRPDRTAAMVFGSGRTAAMVFDAARTAALALGAARTAAIALSPVERRRWHFGPA